MWRGDWRTEFVTASQDDRGEVVAVVVVVDDVVDVDVVDVVM